MYCVTGGHVPLLSSSHIFWKASGTSKNLKTAKHLHKTIGPETLWPNKFPYSVKRWTYTSYSMVSANIQNMSCVYTPCQCTHLNYDCCCLSVQRKELWLKRIPVWLKDASVHRVQCPSVKQGTSAWILVVSIIYLYYEAILHTVAYLLLADNAGNEKLLNFLLC